MGVQGERHLDTAARPGRVCPQIRAARPPTGPPPRRSPGGHIIVATAAYVPRQPTETVLYRVVDEHLNAFMSRAAETYQRPLPSYVIKELRAFLRCGRFDEGVLRCHCHHCGLDVFVPHSCGSRSICPSCASRRMCNTAAFLVDRVLPNVPIRQYVLSLPFELRLLAAARPAVVTALGRMFVEAIFEELKRSVALPDAQCGAVSFLHRAGDSFNLNPHFHVKTLDGVLIEPKRGDGTCQFVAARPPSSETLERLISRLRRRALRWLSRRGFVDERDNHDRESDDGNSETPHPSALEACAQLALSTGAVARLADHSMANGDPVAASSDLEPRRCGPFTVELGGFNVNASVRIRAGDDEGRERLARYCARPSFALGRLSELEDGRLAYRLRYPRRGATHKLMTPLELMARLASFVPPPRRPLVRYYGVLSSHSRLRSQVVPQPPTAPPRQAGRLTSSSGGGSHNAHRRARCRAPVNVQRDQVQSAAIRPTLSQTSVTAGQPKTMVAGSHSVDAILPEPSYSCPPHDSKRSPHYDAAGIELDVLDCINVISVRHLNRLEDGALLAPGPRLDWAKLLRRSLSIDALACPRCGGRLRPIAEITSHGSIQRLADHLAVQPAPRRPIARARAPTTLPNPLR